MFISIILFKFLCSFILISSLKYPLDFQNESDWPQTCKGSKQSPIDFPANLNYNKNNEYFKILETKYNVLNNLKFEKTQKKLNILNVPNQTGGHLIVRKNGINYKYDLLQFHWHYLAEHTINGVALPLELHLVHIKDNAFTLQNNTIVSDPDPNQLMVIGTLWNNNGTDHPVFSNFNLDIDGVVANLDFSGLANPSRRYYHYEGSLTTPTCDETVNWVVMTQAESFSNAQLIQALSVDMAEYSTGTTRKTYPINGREVYLVNGCSYWSVSMVSLIIMIAALML